MGATLRAIALAVGLRHVAPPRSERAHGADVHELDRVEELAERRRRRPRPRSATPRPRARPRRARGRGRVRGGRGAPRPARAAAGAAAAAAATATSKRRPARRARVGALLSLARAAVRAAVQAAAAAAAAVEAAPPAAAGAETGPPRFAPPSPARGVGERSRRWLQSSRGRCRTPRRSFPPTTASVSMSNSFSSKI